ncbi:hypothetical protein ACVIHI_000052 [Bradyrhizobium sp. USDA 4524]|nr:MULTISPECIES: hypothetical protein [unclassified Bradyrhizobium]MCP1838584.1 hypothetical protein [Bradyrhizobium sp. USDA 4538]MCP1899149.1 hypothetical protein [Bradyrhizobium sp. USDA 4537]MCP1986738.1 hypothetical protein [Bradyrhizobium sp. USDA 4539]
MAVEICRSFSVATSQDVNIPEPSIKQHALFLLNGAVRNIATEPNGL